MKWLVEETTPTGEKKITSLNWNMLYDDEKRTIIKRIVWKLILWAIAIGLVSIYYKF